MDFEEFEVIGPIRRVKTIASGRRVKARDRLNQLFGLGRWKKRKAEATVRMRSDGSIRKAEIHWFEAHGVGRVLGKIKYFLD
ncbi:MAG TPA: hypothetical protein VF746_17145 [Longimicrobium sp.]|jgi:hypothetical protein